jgi:aryl-alcohol dehydrogenase-like predicted oxidoreductase
VAYRPLEGGRLKSNSLRERFPSGSPSSTDEKEKVLHETFERIALQRGKSVSQVALNWLLRKDVHVIPIPGTTSDHHALENADTLTFELSDDEFRAIDQASSPWKQYTGRQRRKLLNDMISFGVRRWFRARS